MTHLTSFREYAIMQIINKLTEVIMVARAVQTYLTPEEYIPLKRKGIGSADE